MVEVLSNGRGLLWGHPGVDLPHILRAFSREMPSDYAHTHTHTSTITTPIKQTAEPHLWFDHLLTWDLRFGIELRVES